MLDRLNTHWAAAQYMSGVQKQMGSNTKGAKHQLLLDKAVTQDGKVRQTDLRTAWTDYKKVHDSVEHTWLLE